MWVTAKFGLGLADYTFFFSFSDLVRLFSLYFFFFEIDDMLH
jgi:hypothetical protein